MIGKAAKLTVAISLITSAAILALSSGAQAATVKPITKLPGALCTVEASDRMSGRHNSHSPAVSHMTRPKPRVMYFYAKWARPCQLIDPVIQEAKAKHHSQVDFVSVDVDDKANARTVEQYKIHPVPTVLYLDEFGTVAQMDIGFSGGDSIKSGIKQIVPGS